MAASVLYCGGTSIGQEEIYRMNPRENLLSLYRRTGYEKAPVSFSLCPSLQKTYRDVVGTDLPPEEFYHFPTRDIGDGRLCAQDADTSRFAPCHKDLKPGSRIDEYGVGHEPGSADAKHMTYMRNPLKHCESLSEMRDYPFPDYGRADFSHQKAQVDAVHQRGLAAMGNMQMTIWEQAWYVRGMMELMMDMMSDDPMAEYLLDVVTRNAETRARQFARAGCDILFLGDDIGMQSTIMMSEELYCAYIKPRLARVIAAARQEKGDLLIQYHSCGYVEPLIPHLIDAGVDILNPVQPECMDFSRIHALYGDRLSFNGVIGTQSVMPFSTPDGVRRSVFTALSIAGDKGGLLACPTHLLEPEVPWANVEAYIRACEDFK